MIKEIIESMGTRVKSPLFGYYVFIFFAINWKPVFYVLVSDTDVKERVSFFEDETSFYTLFIIPIILAAIGAIVYPWISYFFLKLCRKPTDLRNSIQAQSEHSLLLEKQKLEEFRSEMLAGKERELIERAKRDQELSEIEDSEKKEKLQLEIEQLRKERDSLSNSQSELEYKHVSDLIALYKERAATAKNSGEWEEYEEFNKKALKLQEQLASRYLNNA